jgi:hypothetical protein
MEDGEINLNRGEKMEGGEIKSHDTSGHLTATGSARQRFACGSYTG